MHHSMKFMNLPFQTKLIFFFVVIALIPLALLGSITYQKSSEIVKEQVSEQVLEGLTQINKNLSFFQKDIEQLCTYIYRNDGIQNVLAKSGSRSSLEKYQDFEQIQGLFDIVMGSKNKDINIYIVGFNGDRYFTGDYLPRQYNQYMKNWGIFRKAEESKGALVWDTHYTIRNADLQDVVLSAGQLLKNPQSGEPLGYLIIDIKESAMVEIYQTENSSYTSQMFLLDNDGYVISSSPSKVTIGLKFTYPTLEKILNSQQGYVNTNFKQNPYIAVYDTNEETHYKLVNYIPEKEMESKSSLIGYITLLIGFMGLGVAILVSVFFANTLTRPINSLITLMRKVEKGNLKAYFNPKYQDEIGTLGKSFNTMISRIEGLVEDSVEKQTRLQQAEIKTLRAQINPHFLFNTLETISVIAKLRGIKVVSEIAVALGDMMRYSIQKNQDYVPVKEDLRLLERYVFIQKVRFHDKFDICINIEETTKQLFIPPLLIQPLVENAITHGLEMKVGHGRLDIDIYQEGQFLFIRVQDDGLGMEKESIFQIMNNESTSKPQSHTGIGIENVKKRIELYFGNGYGLEIISEKYKGTTVCLKLPIIRELKR